MNDLIDLFKRANCIFLKEEKELILSGVSELTLCGSLMCIIKDLIKESKYKEYFVDIEYNRNKGNVKTIMDDKEEVITINCDLIVHSRGKNKEQDNLIAIEMKKSTNRREEKDKDKKRLRLLTRDTYGTDIWPFGGKELPDHVCGYKLGIYYQLNIRSKLVSIEYYYKGNVVKEYNINLDNFIENISADL